MSIKQFFWAAVRMTVSLLCAGAFYVGWLAAFLLAARPDGGAVTVILWLLAPVLTALGFAVGLVVSERLCKIHRGGFLRTLAWPLVGCALGAVVVYWYGPMLIVFGMFVLGAVSVAAREAVHFPGDDVDSPIRGN